MEATITWFYELQHINNERCVIFMVSLTPVYNYMVTIKHKFGQVGLRLFLLTRYYSLTWAAVGHVAEKAGRFSRFKFEHIRLYHFTFLRLYFAV